MTIFKSSFPDVELPEQTINDFLASRRSQFKFNLAEQPAITSHETGKTLTYDELFKQIDKCAVGLHKMGLKQNEVVAVLLPNCIEYAISFLAVLRVGATVTTATITNTAYELSNQFNEASARFLICGTSHAEVAKEIKSKCKKLEDVIFVGESNWTKLFENDGTELPNVKVDIKNDAAVIPFSSGTSGLPKGVILTHYNIVSNISQVLGIEKNYKEGAVIYGILPFSHIYAMTTILLAGLAVGARIITMLKFDFVQFLTGIQKYKLSILHVVPPMVVALAKHPIVDKFDFSSVKVIISGAAPLGPDLQLEVNKRLKVPIKQGYGMTEMSPVSHLVTDDDKIVPGSCGVLIPNCLAKIVGPDGKEIDDPDQEGELCVKGPNIMKGYLNNPKATAETIDKDGFLHTGDVCKRSKDGYYFITDRVKELIKYKGYQVPPAELEGILLTHPAVADAAVVGVPDEEAGELPKAYVVLKPKHTATDKEIIEYVDKKVAPYRKLRGGVEFTDVIPKSPSGKILRRVLKDKERQKQQSKQ